MIAFSVLCGAGIGVGVLLIIASLRGGISLAAPKRIWHRIQNNMLRVSMAVVAGLLVGAFTQWPVAALLSGVFAFSAPRLLGGARRQAAELERTEAIASWAEMLRDTMAAAAGIEQAISATATAAPEPIREEVKALSRRLERQPLVPALRAFADDLEHPTADLIVAALTLASQKHAKRLGERLGSLALSARQDATMRLRVQAGRARTRTSVRVIVGATMGMAAGMLILNRSYLSPFNSAVARLSPKIEA